VNSYVDFTALGQVWLYSLLAVVLITGSFALGARVLAQGEGARATARPAAAQLVLAVSCFTVSAVAVVIGLWFLLDK
jgi:hypothetical protein